jgi:hypothetical protein
MAKAWNWSRDPVSENRYGFRTIYGVHFGLQDGDDVATLLTGKFASGKMFR